MNISTKKKHLIRPGDWGSSGNQVFFLSHAISGEFTSQFLSKVFMEMDKEAGHNLSRARYVKDRTTWANGEPWA